MGMVVCLVVITVILVLLIYSLSKEILFHKHHDIGIDERVLQDCLQSNNSDFHDINKNNECVIEEKEITREEGLRRLERLVRLKPYPDDCDDIITFLREFKDKKKAWKVTSDDLTRIFRKVVPSTWSQLKQFVLSKKCVGNKLSFYLDE